MRILIYSPAFLPLVGGLEFNVATLAEAFAKRGHEVVVWTTTPASAGETPLPPHLYRVVRQPSAYEALKLVRWCDVFEHANVSLHGVWPLLLVRRPWVVSHHSWYCRTGGRVAWQDRLKRWTLRFAAASLAVSQSIADDLATPAEVIPNAYRDQLFRRIPGVDKDRDLVFVGRLVSDKGADLLLDALAKLAAIGKHFDLTVIGDGPERVPLERQARELGLSERVDFKGIQTGYELVEILNRHRVLVAPSRYNEPFGIVALEGIACGCVVIGTAGGGLPEAIGACGVVIPNQDVGALAGAIDRVLSDDELRNRLTDCSPAHLSSHTVAHVSERYLHVFRRITTPKAHRA